MTAIRISEWMGDDDHIMSYRLIRRLLFLQGTEPEEIERHITQRYPAVFRRLAKDVLGEEVSPQRATKPKVSVVRDYVSAEVRRLEAENPGRARADLSYPLGWRAALRGGG